MQTSATDNRQTGEGTALLGIDTGGTFTDFVLLDGDQLTVHKVLSDPAAPEQAILKGIDDLGLTERTARGELVIIHGTTVATNATLEHKGVRTAYITNRGMGDVLQIGRQTRDELYNLTPTMPELPFSDELTIEVDCRVDANGNIIEALSEASLDAVAERVRALAPEAVAINLLFSFLNDTHERQIEARLPDVFVSRSSWVLPEYKEYERGMTTWLNAWIGPLIQRYLSALEQSIAPTPLAIMQSSGLTIAAGQAATRAVNLLLSGPAGGLSGALHIGRSAGTDQLMTFDMGGTSSDVSLLDGDVRLTSDGKIDRFRVGVPMADIHTIGAGGGSIAYVDDGGLLQVGPESAGARPGPACYGQGGTRPTVTDANLVLGRLRPGAFLGGRMSLDVAAAEAAIAHLAAPLGMTTREVAEGIVQIANEHMAQALRVISIQRGFDPSDFTLVCFGGAGGLHFAALAEALDMRRAIVPIHSGALSALGMLTSQPGRELARTHQARLESITDLDSLFDQLVETGRAELLAEGHQDAEVGKSLDLRYEGQTFTLNVPATSVEASIAAFHAAHEAQYGHRLPRPVELVNVRAHVTARRSPLTLPAIETGQGASHYDVVGGGTETRIYDRDALRAGATFSGPAIVTETHSTTLFPEGWTVTVDKTGNLLAEREEAK